MRSFLVPFAIVIAVGCGGRTADTDLDAGTGGPTGSGGTTGTGGSTNTGGSGGTTTGGTTTGGATTGGTTGGSGGTGAGGAGGAGGNDPAFRACTGPGQCELAPSKCCACGALALDQLTPINSAKRGEFTRSICGDMAPCPPCVATPARNLMARCESGMCRGFDIGQDPTYTKCGTDQECVLRNGLGCCECNATGPWTAVSRTGAMVLTGQVCGPNTACPACVPTPPAGTIARCRNGACMAEP